MISGRDALFSVLEGERVEYVFGNPGTTELAFYDELAVRETPRLILALQEATAVAMAGGYAQASGRTGVVSLHITPGLGNAMGCLYDAWKQGVPLVVLAGQQDSRHLLEEPNLVGDMVAMARPVTRWAHEVRAPTEIGVALRRAFAIARTPPSGPVFVSIPMDHLEATADIPVPAPTEISHDARAAGVDAAADLLATARNPVVIAGEQVAYDDALAELTEVAEVLGARVWAEPVAGITCFPTDHDLFAGTLYPANSAVRDALAGHDAVLVAGAAMFYNFRYDAAEPVPAGTAVVQVDARAGELAKTFAVAHALHGGLAATLSALASRIGARGVPGSTERRRAAAASRADARVAARARAAAAADQATPPAAAAVMAALDGMPAGGVVVDESPTAGYFARAFHESGTARSYLSGLRAGGLGWGTGAAVGAKLARPDRPVLGLIGDGSLLYTPQALWSAAHHEVAVVWVVLNNRGYRILRQGLDAMAGQAAKLGVYPGMDVDAPPVDFVGLARSLGVEGHAVATPDELRDAVAAAFASGRPRLVEIAVL